MKKKHISAYKTTALNPNRITKKKKPERVSAYSTAETNRGGLLEGTGYVAGRLGLGIAGVGEGLGDIVSAGGDLLRGDTEMAKYRFLDNRTAEAQQSLTDWYNPGKGMQFAGDVASGVGQSSVFLLDALVPGLGTGLFFTGITGQSVAGAAQQTGDVGLKEIGYGVASGAAEAALGKLVGAGGKVAGKLGSSLTRSTGKAIGQRGVTTALTKATGKKLAGMSWNVAKNTLADAAGEFTEEFAAEYIDTGLQRLFGIDPNASTSFGEALRAGAVGFVSGAAMGAPANVYNYNNSVAAGRAIREEGGVDQLLYRAAATVDVLKEQEAQAREKGRTKATVPEDAGLVGKTAAKGKQAVANLGAKITASKTKGYWTKLEKNINAYMNMDEAMRNSDVGDALLGELRGNLFFTNLSYAVEEEEETLKTATDEEITEWLVEVNDKAKKAGKADANYTVEDFRANKDGILSTVAAARWIDKIRRTANGTKTDETATESPAEPTQAPQDTTAEEVTAQEENDATEATEAAEPDPWESVEGIEGFGTQNAQEEALLRAASSQGVPKRTVPAMLKSYREGTDLTPAEFAEAWGDGVMFFGRLGLNESAIYKDSPLDRIGENARRASIQEGKTIADEELKRAKEKAEKKKMPARNQADAKRKQEGRGAIVKGKGLIVQDLDAAQYTAYKAAEMLAPVLGTDIVIETDLKTDTGKQINGFYSQKTNGIHININAKRNGQSIALYTLGHEVTHYIKAWSPEKFKALSDFVLNQLGDKAPDLIAAKAEFLRKMPDYKDYTVNQLNDLAVEEVVADSMELVLSDGKILDELARTEKTVWQKIKDFITKIIADIRKYYGELNQASKTAQVLRETVDSLDEIEQLFYEGVTEAGERTRTEGIETITRMNEEKMHDSDRVYSSPDARSQEMLDFYDSVLKMKDRVSMSKRQKKLGAVSVSHAKLVSETIKKETGKDIDLSGYELWIDGSAVEHIEKRHGKNGRADHSMKDREDIARIPWVANAADQAIVMKKDNGEFDMDSQYKNSDMSPSYKVKLSYKIGESTYYVTECVPDSESKKMHIVSAYIEKGSKGQELDMDSDESPQLTSETLLDSNATKDSIAQTDDSVNSKFSISEENSSDTAYLAAVERGDMETAQKMVDEAAKRAGYDIKAYHGTTNQEEHRKWDSKRNEWETTYTPFTVFKRQYDEQAGHFFSSDESNAGGYGSYLYSVYLMLKKPLVIECNGQSYNSISFEGQEMDTYEWAEYARKRRYDGVVFKNVRDGVGYADLTAPTTDYVVFDSNRIKSADPVTYDNNGDIIPLSERFKVIQRDIRYSIDETPETPDVSDSAATDRDLLLAMAEQLVGSEEENRILTNYKTNYETQKARQARLDELTDEMREQQSTMMYDESAEKRSAAAKRLPAIYKEMSKISEQLADADRKLTEIEGMKAIRNLLKREAVKAREIQKNIYDTRAKAKREAAETTELRRKTRRIYNRVLRLLVSPNRKRNIPYELQGIAAEALKTANMDLEAMKRLEKLEQELTALEREAVPDVEKIAQKEEEIEDQEKKVGKTKDHLQVMIEIFEKAKDIKEGVGRSVYDESALAKLKDLQSKIGNTTIGRMNREQLQALKDFYDILYTRISNANKMLSEEREATVEEYGSKATTEAHDAKSLKFLSPKSMELKGMANVRQFFWKNMKPLTVFEAIGSDTFTRLFQSVLNGENVWARDIEEARKKIVETRDKYGYDKWELDKRTEVKDKDGKTVRLSLSEMMSLYAYAKRKQAMGHLEGGGFVLDPGATEMAKGKVISFADMERRLNHAERHVVDQLIIGEIASKLTAEQKSYVDEMQTYLTKLGERGNTVSRKLYGIDIFTEEFYFPIKVKSEYLESHTGRTGDPNIKNRGMTKEVTPEADNPLVLQGFDAVMVDHINSMATYHAFVLPVEDLTRVLNYKPSNAKIDEDGNWTVDESRKDYSTLKAVIEEKYGAEANHYIEQLIRDLNGGARRDAAATLLDKGITGFKRASTMASLSVLFQQPTSLIRAAAYIDPKYLFGQASIVDFANHKKLWERLCKYAPVGIIKEMGGYDTGVGARTGDYLNAKNYKTTQEKLEAFFKPERYGGDANYRAEVFGRGAAYADEMAWIQMFEACVSEQADKLGKSRDSEEVLKAAGKRFEDVVRRTQVYDSTLTRTEFMRSKDTGMKMATAFMAEPSTVVSMVADAIMKAERGDTAFRRRTAGAVAGAVIINALASSLIYAMRDDDEEKTYGEKYVASVAMEAAEAINLFEYLPYFRDIMSIMKGYEIERTDMTLISNLFQQVELLTSSKRTVGEKMLGVSGAVSAFFGIPMTNLTRDAKGIVNTFMGGVDTERGTARGMSAALKEEFSGIFGLFDEQTKNEYQLYQAYVSGDTAHYNRVKARYKSESAAEQALRQALRDHEPRISEAAEARLSGDLAVYESIVDQIESEGIFDRNIVIRAINNEMLDLKDEDTSKLVPKDETVTDEEEETSESLYKASDLNNALERGDTEDFAAILAALVEDKVSAGKTEAQAKASVKSSITAHWKKLYIEAWSRDDTEERKRIIAILTETGLYGTRNDVATLAQNWVKNSK